jgi:hypothetical protein
MITSPDLSPGANYRLSEVLEGQVVGAACTPGTPGTPAFSLLGYTVGDTEALAAAATPALTAPVLTAITTNKHIIVWNHACATTGTGGGSTGQIGGNVSGAGSGTLAVTSVDSVDTSAVADGTFENGWKHVFNITVPTSEPNIAVKFADWLKTGGGGTIPVANKMRISSPQADNSNATVLLTAANLYSTPKLHLTGDLDPLLPGMQIKVTVETAVAVGTPDGAYTTTYGVLTN